MGEKPLIPNKQSAQSDWLSAGINQLEFPEGPIIPVWLQTLSAEINRLKARVRTLEALHQGDAKLSKTEAAKLLGVHPKMLNPILEAAFKAFREGTEYPITWGIHGDVYVHGSSWLIDRGALDRIQELLGE